MADTEPEVSVADLRAYDAKLQKKGLGMVDKVLSLKDFHRLEAKVDTLLEKMETLLLGEQAEAKAAKKG